MPSLNLGTWERGGASGAPARTIHIVSRAEGQPLLEGGHMNPEATIKGW